MKVRGSMDLETIDQLIDSIKRIIQEEKVILIPDKRKNLP